MKYFSLALLATTVSFTACKPTIEGSTPSKGSVDFSNYTAIGNSLTAGFADGSLYRSGQINSYPNMLAGQFKLVGGGEFKQPLLPGEGGWPLSRPKLVLAPVTGCDGVPGLAPIPFPGSRADSAGSITNISAQGPYNNLGVPGIRAIDYLAPGYARVYFLGAPGYAFRFYDNPATDRPIDMAGRSKHTFFTMWLGANDVLGYATSGGAGVVNGTNPDDISPVSIFQASYQATVDTMTAKGQKGVLINIPDVTTIPYFTTVPANGLKLTKDQAAALTANYAPLSIKFNEGANPFIIADATTGRPRQIRSGEYLILTTPQDSLKCGGWGSLKPIPANFVLDSTEVANVKNATQTFNAFIQQMAVAKGLAYVDMNNYLKTLQSGITYNGLTFTPTFVTGGAFSLDGVHLTPRGYALAANQIIMAINAKYGSSVPQVDVTKYNGVLFPG